MLVLVAGAFFSVLFNLQKFTLFEQRDPVSVKQELNEQGITYVRCVCVCAFGDMATLTVVFVCSQWDRYAQFEYMKLAEEEEGGGGMMDGGGGGNDEALGSW